MSTTTFVLALIGAIVGSSGISSVLTAIFTHKKENDQHKLDFDKYVNEKLKDLTETYVDETKKLRELNSEMQGEINRLNRKLNILMNWIVTENKNDIVFLQNKIREYDPDFEYHFSDIPDVWEDNDRNDHKENQ